MRTLPRNWGDRSSTVTAAPASAAVMAAKNPAAPPPTMMIFGPVNECRLPRRAPDVLPIPPGSLAEKLADGREGGDVIAHDLHGHEQRHGEERAGDAPQPGPEDEGDEYHDRIEGEATAQH